MFSSYHGSPMHSPSMMTSMNQKRLFDSDHHAWTNPSSPMYQQQRQDSNIYSGVLDERDKSVPVPSRMGTTIQSHLSPRNRTYGLISTHQYPNGDAGLLQGVWSVFDSVTSELGKELLDCLSNKAIFEACVVQEQSHYQGKRMTASEKNEEANQRKAKYEDALNITLVRQKGLFANAVMTAKKEIQSALDRRTAEIELRFTRQSAELERSYAKRISDQEDHFNRSKDDFNREIRRLQNECDKSESAFQKLQNEMSIQRQTLTQSLHDTEKGREAAVSELTSTLETLKSTCASARDTEKRLHKFEREICELQTQHQLESDRVRVASEAWTMECERANLLQETLDAEVETNKILRSEQEEMKQVIGIEQERSYLLQQKLDKESHSKRNIEKTLEDASQNLEQVINENNELREQVQQVSRLQNALSETIKSLRVTKQEFEQLSEEFRNCQESLEQASEMNAMLVSKVSSLESQVEDQLLDLQAARMSEADVEATLEESTKKVDELTTNLNDTKALLQKSLQQIKELSEKDHDHSDQVVTLKQAKAENEKLKRINTSLGKERDDLKKSMKRLQEEYETERNQISSALEGFDEEMASAETKLRSAQKALEDEKAKVKLLELPLDEATLKFKDEIATLKAESEMARNKLEKEASVYNEAIKMLQKQVDILQGLVDSGCEKCSSRYEDRASISQIKNEVYDMKLVVELEEMLKEKDNQIIDLKEKCYKREESIVTLEKLCAKARNDLMNLRSQKNDLEQRYRDIQANMIERCDDIARCDDGTNKAVDDLVGPIIDAAPSLNEIDDMIDKGEKEFKTIMSNVEKQLRIGVKACGEYAVECALDDEAYPMTKSHRKDRGLENYNDDDHV